MTGEGIVNKAVLHRKLELFIMEHLQKLNSNDDTAELYENLRLISKLIGVIIQSLHINLCIFQCSGYFFLNFSFFPKNKY